MGRIALAGGQAFATLPAWQDASRIEVSSERGPVELLDAGRFLVLARHGLSRYTPPHLIDHPRNLAALREAGCDRLLAICSVGGLRPELGVGTFVCPDDFIGLARVDAAFDDERGHVVPGFEGDWRRLVLDSWRRTTEIPLVEGGVYWQSPGPRFETQAEVRLIAAHADVVGMTMASECATATQLGLPYAAICLVDNLANGVAAAPLTQDEYEAGIAANRERLTAALGALLPALISEPR